MTPVDHTLLKPQTHNDNLIRGRRRQGIFKFRSALLPLPYQFPNLSLVQCSQEGVSKAEKLGVCGTEVVFKRKHWQVLDKRRKSAGLGEERDRGSQRKSERKARAIFSTSSCQVQGCGIRERAADWC